MKKLLLVIGLLISLTLVCTPVVASDCENIKKICEQVIELRNAGVSKTVILSTTNSKALKTLVSSIYEADPSIPPSIVGAICYTKCMESK